MFYKIAYDYYRHKSKSASSTFLSRLAEFIFEKKEHGLKNRLFFRRLENLVRSFYSTMDEIRVPTHEYIQILAALHG